MEHLSKLEHAAATEPRVGWQRTILAQRADLAEDVTPSLRPRIGRNLARFYAAARTEAAAALRAHGEHVADTLPTTCPYSLDQLAGDWLPNQAGEEEPRERS